jgi:hypothetical protein
LPITSFKHGGRIEKNNLNARTEAHQQGSTICASPMHQGHICRHQEQVKDVVIHHPFDISSKNSERTERFCNVDAKPKP